jgi:hypothetical protein
MDHICKRCEYKTNLVANLKNHLHRKNHCIDKTMCGLSCEDILKTLEKDTSNYKFSCNSCEMKFANRQGRYRHVCKLENSDVKKKKLVQNNQTISQQELISLHLELEKSHVKKKNLFVQNNQATSQQEMLSLRLELQYYKNRKNELFYQLLLENYLGGTHKTVKNGITDITTDDTHAEIKEFKCWKEGVGQLVCYNAVDKKDNLCLYLFGKYSQTCKRIVFETCELCGIKTYYFEENENGISIIESSSKNVLHIFKPLSS